MAKSITYWLARISAVTVFCLTLLSSEACTLTIAIADPVDDYIRNQIITRHMPGVSAAVVHEGKLIKAAGYGYASVETRTKATADTRYVIALITKAFTGISILMLADDRRLSLENHIYQYLDGKPEEWKSMALGAGGWGAPSQHL